VSGGDGSTLLDFLRSPVVVGDPEGRVIYANSAFEQRMQLDPGQASGEQMAALFGGGGREAVLQAVAEVCQRGDAVQFRLREAECAYLAQASPIEAGEDRVGVMILMVDEPLGDDRVLTIHREIQEPLEEVRVCLEELIEQTGGRRSERFRSIVEKGIGAVDRVIKWSDELHSLVSGRGSEVAEGAVLDAVRVVRQAAQRLSPDFEKSGASLVLLIPAELPAARGDATRLEAALVRLLRDRLAEVSAGDVVTLAARCTRGSARSSMLVSVVAPQPRSRPIGVEEADDEPSEVREAVTALGGRIVSISDAKAGRVTAIELQTCR